jgi:cytidylate kinase
MSGGEALAKCLAERLESPLLGREILVEAAADLGVSEDMLTQKVWKGPGIWDRLSSDRRLYIVGVQAALAEHALGGDLVYHGHAGHLLLRSIPRVLRVRLIAPLASRVKALMESRQMSEAAAADYIEHVDAERVRWTKFIYGEDWSNPAIYDAVINLEKISLATACDLLAEASRRPEFAVDAGTREALADFLLSCKVKVALAVAVETRAIDFEVTARDGTVQVSGEMPTAGILIQTIAHGNAEVTRIAESVPGVKKVVLNIRR